MEALKKELELAREKALELEQRLEQERILRREAEGVQGRKFLGEEAKPEMKELLEDMARLPLLYHEVMAQFYRFKEERRELVEKPVPSIKFSQNSSRFLAPGNRPAIPITDGGVTKHVYNRDIPAKYLFQLIIRLDDFNGGASQVENRSQSRSPWQMGRFLTSMSDFLRHTGYNTGIFL